MGHPDMVVQISNPGTLEEETGPSGAQGRLGYVLSSRTTNLHEMLSQTTNPDQKWESAGSS